MNGRDLRRSATGPEGRSRLAHWLFAAVLFTIFWTASSASVQAWQASASSASASGSSTARWDVAPHDLPRRLEAALPDPVDSAGHPDVDIDAAVPRRPAIDVVFAATPHARIEPRVGASSPARTFDARAPPPLR